MDHKLPDGCTSRETCTEEQLTTPYDDGLFICTVGWGTVLHNNSGVFDPIFGATGPCSSMPGYYKGWRPIDYSTMVKWFDATLANIAWASTENITKHPLTQWEFDALASFLFNRGWEWLYFNSYGEATRLLLR
jgi:GH24 family phage-related lysozyme (muramidase)